MSSSKISLKPRATANNESVYAWYPPTWNVFSKPKYKEPDAYATEYLYKQCYRVGSPETKIPTPPVSGRPKSSPTKDLRKSRPPRPPSLRLTRPQSVNTGAALKRQLKQDEEKRREDQLNIRIDTKCASPTPSIRHEFAKTTPTPPANLLSQSWRFTKEKDFIADYVLRPLEGPDRIPKPHLEDYGFKYATDSAEACVCGSQSPPSGRPLSAMSPVREKTIPAKRPGTATSVRRPKFPLVPDMEQLEQELRKSSSPCIAPSPDQSEISVACTQNSADTEIKPRESVDEGNKKLQRVKSAPASCRSPPIRPHSPTPDMKPVSPEQQESRPLTASSAQPPQDDEELTYEKLVSMYGWKAQIHGDPLNLKKKIMRERLPYTVSCSVSEPKREPPKMHHEVWDTFFYNTIPKKPMTFTIAPDWVSEVFHAKRMELQKRDGGVNYRYKDFAFVY